MSLRTITLSIPSMHCGSCEKKILTKLAEFHLAGSRTDFSTREMTLTFNPEQVRSIQLKQAVEASGFPGAKMETKDNG